MALMRKIFAVFLAMTFMLSSLLLNFLQLVLFLVVKPLDVTLYRRINYYLIYSSWSQVVALAEWWSGSHCSIYADEETWKHFGKEHSIALMNHKYEIDWAVCWMVVDKMGILGAAKSFAKSSLKKLPIIGWGWIFCEMIFLERNWEKDSSTMKEGLDIIMEYKDKCLILLFAEGTRFTKEKHATSLQFAKEKGLPELKYHLLPRTKGFNYCVKHLDGKMEAIYNIQVTFSKDSAEPTASSLLWGGKPVKAHMYVHRIPLNEIPTQDDKKCSEWLYDLYRHKDQLMEGFEKEGRFPGIQKDLHRRWPAVLNLGGWAIVVGSPIFYFLLKALLFGSSIKVAIAATIIACLSSAIYLMMRATKAGKGSSYGKALSPAKTPIKTEPKGMEPIIEENNS